MSNPLGRKREGLPSDYRTPGRVPDREQDEAVMKINHGARGGATGED